MLVTRTARQARISLLIALALVLTVLAVPASASEPYDPATESGSLYNVAKRIKLFTGQSGAAQYSGAGVQIALIDTGIVDVAGLRNSNVVIGPDFSFEDANDDLRARDTNGHGTHMAGIIVASDAAWVAGDKVRTPERVLGIAPDAELVSIKVGASDGGVDVSQVIAGINWVVDNRNAPGFDIRVINLSFGTVSYQDYLIDPLAHAVERAWNAGIVVVVAAGNDGAGTESLRNPAISPYVIAVGASEAGNGRGEAPSDFTNGSLDRGVDIVAPGKSIVSLRNPGSFSDQYNETGRIGEDLLKGTGTSQAAAVVSGAAALLIEQHPDITPDQVKKVLMDSAHFDPQATTSTTGAGFLNMWRSHRDHLSPYVQEWPPSTGSGSIHLSRGSSLVSLDGHDIFGEIDIFGNNFADSGWAEDSWTGNSWTGNSWTGNSWTGNEWTGNSWTGNSWTGNSWTGNSWTGNSWTGNEWTGNSWTGNSWTGNSWTGNSWTGNEWTGFFHGLRPSDDGGRTWSPILTSVDTLTGTGDTSSDRYAAWS